MASSNYTTITPEIADELSRIIGGGWRGRGFCDHVCVLCSRCSRLSGPTPTPDTSGFIQRQIDATDRQIDRLVYELYVLTEEEISIVEKFGSN